MPRDALHTSPHKLAFASRRRDPETKREAVLQTAAQLFLEKSYSRTSLNDVAERLHITKPALYHYFQNKEELLLEIYRLGSRMIENILNDISAQCGTGLEKVEAFIRSYANVMTVNFGRCVMRLDEGDLSRAAFAEVRAYKRRIDRRLRGFIQEGTADGSILACNPKIAAFTIAGALNWICIWYEPEGALTPEQIGSEFARTLTQGLAAGRRERALKSPPRRRDAENETLRKRAKAAGDRARSDSGAKVEPADEGDGRGRRGSMARVPRRLGASAVKILTGNPTRGESQ